MTRLCLSGLYLYMRSSSAMAHMLARISAGRRGKAWKMDLLIDLLALEERFFGMGTPLNLSRNGLGYSSLVSWYIFLYQALASIV